MSDEVVAQLKQLNQQVSVTNKFLFRILEELQKKKG